jgi:hypothetical protein
VSERQPIPAVVLEFLMSVLQKLERRLAARQAQVAGEKQAGTPTGGEEQG